MLVVLVVALAAGFAIVAVVRRPDPLQRAALLRRTGFGLMALFTFIFGAFIIGETFTDPGGWNAAGLVAAWAVPLAGLTVLSWLRPGWAISVFTTLAAAAIAVSIWFALNPQAWRSFENRHGPIRAVIIFVLAASIAVLGLKRPAAAGVLLLTIGIIPVAVSSLGSFPGFASLSVVSAAPAMTGVIYLSSAYLAKRRMPPGLASSRPAERPKAA